MEEYIIFTNPDGVKYIRLNDTNMIISNPEIISHYTKTATWPGEVREIGRDLIRPCAIARKCLDVDDGKEQCKMSKPCERDYQGELRVELLPYKYLPKY